MNETLSQEAQIATRFINQTNKHVFLTGKAGSGKTTFLKHIIKHTHKKCAVVAPTGIAAINAGGSTIHSLFQLPFGSFVPVQNYNLPLNDSFQIHDRNALFSNTQMNKQKRAVIREIELLIIDEVSMLRSDVLDAMDAIMRQVRRKPHLSFGGAQVLFIGDMYQLPPVIKDAEWHILHTYYKSIYFFDALVLQNETPIYIELDKIYRQSNLEFIGLLNNLRNNTITQDNVTLLNKFFNPEFKQGINDNYITLTTHNYKALSINKEFLSKLDKTSYYYDAEISDEFSDSMFPVEKTLELKIGAQVMFIKNDLSGKQLFYNGKLAKVIKLEKSNITVVFEDGQLIELEKYTWENKRFKVNATTNEIEEEVVGKFIHYPVKLAWAITVHKSQGLTFEKAIIDVGDAFAPGQVYVALSRLKDMKGLVLTSPINLTSINNDAKINSFANTKNIQADLGQQLNNETIKFLKHYLSACYDFTWLNNSLLKHHLEYVLNNTSKFKPKFLNWMEALVVKTSEIKANADKFCNQINNIIGQAGPEWTQTLLQRVKDAQGYFSPILKESSVSILAQLEIMSEEKKVKLYTKELAKQEILFFEQYKKVEKAVGLCEAIMKGEDYTKLAYSKIVDETNRVEIAGDHQEDKKPKKKGEKAKKIDTKKVSLDLYLEGLTIEEISEKRELAVTTIEGHMAHYIKLGVLKAIVFISQEKIDKIISTSNALDTTALKAIKEVVGSDFSFSDIKFALATIPKAE